MTRRFVTALLLGACGLVVAAQRPTFEVASIKHNVEVSDRIFVRAEPGGRVSIGNNTLRNIIRNAWRLQEFQIVGGPDWINTERWNIVAKAPDNAPPDQMLVMLQNLLIDRFKLVIKRELRDTPIYALVLARPGTPPPRPADGGPMCGTRMTFGRMQTNSTTMADLARNLAQVAGRSVVDKTGLTGFFDLELTGTQDGPPPPGAVGDRLPPPPENGASIFTALQEQLGLKLNAQRGPVDTLVIEAAERPVED
jgi:uncharacterized protein (TIGR03435 family)